VSVSGRAAVSLTQPLAVPPVVMSLRYPALPVWTTCAMARIGLIAVSSRAIAASICCGTA